VLEKVDKEITKQQFLDKEVKKRLVKCIFEQDGTLHMEI
jgi:hypothetical protein